MARSLGFGLGLRPDHYESILAEQPAIDFFEALSENYLVAGGKPLHYLERIRERYPVVLHGVSMSIGATSALDLEYLRSLKALIRRIEPAWVSDHLCWTGVDGVNLHDLMPLPYTEAALQHVAARVRQVQDLLGQQLLLENVSSYVGYSASAMSEWEFLSRLTEASDCLLLFDVNNVYVNSVNHRFDPLEFVNGVPPERVRQLHLAGHDHHGHYIVDTHDAPVADPVWTLFQRVCERFGPISTLLERDANIPPLGELVAELDLARRMARLPEAA